MSTANMPAASDDPMSTDDIIDEFCASTEVHYGEITSRAIEALSNLLAQMNVEEVFDLSALTEVPLTKEAARKMRDMIATDL